MFVQWLLAAYLLLTLLLVASVLCGQWPIFQGTIVEKIHYFIAYGAYEYLLQFVGIIFGSRGRNAIVAVEQCCCYRPNPTLQIMYLGIIGGTFYFTAYLSFPYIPGLYASRIHKYTSCLAVAVGVLLFLLTSLSDPGIVTSKNVSKYIRAYPYDNILYTEKGCSTCKISRPARSKHCRICDRCVARFDHHCGWMNNCIGEKNIRYFIAFLLWHFLLCLYGTYILVLVLAGELEKHKIIYILTVYYGVEDSFSALFPHVVQWLLGSFNAQILLMVFLLVVSLLLVGFFGYHAHLCLTNTTTNETFKWQEYMVWKKKQSEEKECSDALKAGVSTVHDGQKPPLRKWRIFSRKSASNSKEDAIEDNIYNQGILRNLHEVVCPLSQRSSFEHEKSE